MQHADLINIAKAFGYESISDEGLCHGFSLMWIQAACSGDLKSFNNRLKVLDTYKNNPKKLIEKIDSIRDKCKDSHYHPTEEEQNLLEIPAFFDGVALHQSPDFHNDLFSRYLVQTHHDAIAEFTNSVLNIKQDGIKTAFSTVDQYDHQQLVAYLTRIANQMGNEPNVALLFRSGNHSVAARYLGNGKFEYIDTNLLVNGNITRWTGDAQGLATQLFISLGTEFGINPPQSLCLSSSVLISGNAPSINFESLRNQSKINTKLNKNYDGTTVLHLAATQNDVGLLKRIDFAKVNINSTDRNGMTPVMYAFSNQSKDACQFLVAHKNIDLNRANSRGLTILNVLAQQNRLLELRTWLQDKRINVSNSPYLLRDLALYKSDEACIIAEQLLTVNKMNPNLSIPEGHSPLHVSCGIKDTKMASLLLEHGININAQTHEGETALHIAARTGSMKVINLLMQKNPDFNLRNKQGETPLITALKLSMPRMTEKLLGQTTLDRHDFVNFRSLYVSSFAPVLQKKILIKGLNDYIDQRGKESSYHNFLRLGYSKDEKITAARALLEHLDNPNVELTQCAKILNNGELGNLYSYWKNYQQNLESPIQTQINIPQLQDPAVTQDYRKTLTQLKAKQNGIEPAASSDPVKGV